MSIVWFESVESTNNEIKKAISSGKKEKTAIAAFEQRGGYGRQGRSWSSPQGGLYLSLILMPFDHGVSTEHISSLTLAISLAVKRLLVSYGLDGQTRIKWPNDVLVSGKKISGISVELVDGAACVGIGVNIFEPNERRINEKEMPDHNKYKVSYLVKLLDDLPCETNVSSGVLTDPQKRFIQKIADTLLFEVYSVYNQWLKGGFPHLRDEYQACSALQGQTVRLLSLSDDILHEGTVCGIDDQGCLVLELSDGRLIHASSGEVHLI